jgi:hypothetical protein
LDVSWRPRHTLYRHDPMLLLLLLLLQLIPIMP